MSEIARLRRLVDLREEDESAIRRHRLQLGEVIGAWKPEYEAWFRRTTAWPEAASPFIPEYLETLVGGDYRDVFYAVQYRQATYWCKRHVDIAYLVANSAKLRAFFSQVGERWQAPALIHALCKVVDLSHAIHAMVYHLAYTLTSLRQTVAREIFRLRSMCGVVEGEEHRGPLGAYVEHLQWKIRAYALALEEMDPDDILPLSPRDCALGRWIEEGGIALIPEEEREGFLAAHERLHRLMAMVFEEAKAGHPEHILSYLMDVEAASDEIAAILGASVDREIRALILMDKLTGLGNRRAFDQALERILAHAKRKGEGFGLLLIDIDRFKEFNDRYGHDIGDMVLKEVARVMQGMLRKEDLLFRWGGEEFAAIVLSPGRADLCRVAERIRRALARHRITTPLGDLGVTVSIGGIFVEPDMHQEPEKLFHEVDQRLYYAKEAGRNRVAC
ncbi:MAG: sensor domain-containing diguanylate cyclase [Gammaproteobacteria bacterium]|nr:MAG: sensor domain-containing diguanylate cyclase [Gammaproteobacteria bacterium]